MTLLRGSSLPPFLPSLRLRSSLLPSLRLPSPADHATLSSRAVFSSFNAPLPPHPSSDNKSLHLPPPLPPLTVTPSLSRSLFPPSLLPDNKSLHLTYGRVSAGSVTADPAAAAAAASAADGEL